MRTRLQAVSEEDATLIAEPAVPSVASPEPPKGRFVDVGELTHLLVLALSERAAAVLTAVINMALLASVFVLMLMIMESPTSPQLIAVSGYAVFVLITLYLRRN